MAASSTAVSVLAPNGRRQTVKVSPSTPLLQVLEEVCKKHGYNPDDHGLKFQRNVLDLTLQWRFASLPNNAKLEVVPSARQRGGTESPVRIALQLEDGSRLQGSFSSSQNLWELLTHFPEARISELRVPGPTPVCVYMRDEITGEEALKRTTLRSLGLTGGSAIVRYVLKGVNVPEPGEPMEMVATASKSSRSPQHHKLSVTSSDKLPPKLASTEVISESLDSPAPSSEDSVGTNRAVPDKEEEKLEDKLELSQDHPQDVRPKIQQANQRTPQKPLGDEEQPGTSQQSHARLVSNFVPFSGGGQRLGGPGDDRPKELSSSASSSSLSPLSSGPPRAKKSKPSHEVQSSAGAKYGTKETEDGEEYLEAVEREPLVYHLDTTTRRHGHDEELTDEFFEVTVDDVRKRFSQLKSERRVLEEAPLMTQALREAQIKEKMDRYPKVVLRVQFPDRRVLQGFFRPLETVAALKQFVRSHLQDPEIRFYLFIAPPKTVLDDLSATLFQANLFPAALVYFGSDAKADCYLRNDLVDSSVSALQADEVIAGCMPRSPAPSSSSSLPPENSLSLDMASSAAPSAQPEPEPSSDPQNQAAKPVRTDPAKVPKWLKLPGKK